MTSVDDILNEMPDGETGEEMVPVRHESLAERSKKGKEEKEIAVPQFLKRPFVIMYGIIFVLLVFIVMLAILQFSDRPTGGEEGPQNGAPVSGSPTTTGTPAPVITNPDGTTITPTKRPGISPEPGYTEPPSGNTKPPVNTTPTPTPDPTITDDPNASPTPTPEGGEQLPEGGDLTPTVPPEGGDVTPTVPPEGGDVTPTVPPEGGDVTPEPPSPTPEASPTPTPTVAPDVPVVNPDTPVEGPVNPAEV